MFCPNCRCEYVEGIKECPDCKVPLVEELQPEQQLAFKPMIKCATVLAIIGITYGFALRTVGSFFPIIFKNLLLVRVTSILFFISGLTIVFFFISFYYGYIQKEQTKLKIATVLAIIGNFLVSLLFVKGILLAFAINQFPYLRRPYFIEPVVPWVSSIFILIFFIVFHQEVLLKESIKLRKAVFFAIIGSLIVVLLRSFMLYTYINTGVVRWFSDFSRVIMIAFLPVVTFSFITILYFFLVFYKEQS